MSQQFDTEGLRKIRQILRQVILSLDGDSNSRQEPTAMFGYQSMVPRACCASVAIIWLKSPLLPNFRVKLGKLLINHIDNSSVWKEESLVVHLNYTGQRGMEERWQRLFSCVRFE